MQFLIIAHDGKDPGALERRMAVREAHLANVRPLKAKGHILIGGAILDEGGRMIGSTVIADYPDRAALDAWLQNDPYVTGGVWQEIEVRPFRAAKLD
jgi:uncharacterized protein YciI